MNQSQAIAILREALRHAADEANIDRAREIADEALAATAEVEDGWLPIETAPKNSRVLVCGGYADQPEIANIDERGNVFLELWDERRLSSDPPDTVTHYIPLPPAPQEKDHDAALPR